MYNAITKERGHRISPIEVVSSIKPCPAPVRAYLVTGNVPASLSNEFGGLLVDVGASGRNVVLRYVLNQISIKADVEHYIPQ